MSITYFKRFRMEVPLRGSFPSAGLPKDYRLLHWDHTLVPHHADAKYRSFCSEIDSHVFPCLGDAAGCLRLMEEISEKRGFLPDSTWLLTHGNVENSMTACGTVQGIADDHGCGSIQNLGITPEHRGLGLGTHLLVKALEGFHQAGLRRAVLEVTAQNTDAIRLYRRLGFRKVKTVYKAVEVAYS